MSRKHEAFPLDDRLAAAFTDGATPDTVAALIQEAEAAARAAGDAAEQAVSRLRERLTASAGGRGGRSPTCGLRGGQG